MASTKKELVSGVIYMAVSKYSGIIVSLVVAGILARLIARGVWCRSDRHRHHLLFQYFQ